jgi:hypothetical protein
MYYFLLCKVRTSSILLLPRTNHQKMPVPFLKCWRANALHFPSSPLCQRINFIGCLLLTLVCSFDSAWGKTESV